MKTSALTLGALALTTVSTLLVSTPAAASVCTIAVQQNRINNGQELWDGVPNYAQGDFSPGSGDCSPTGIAMVMGYWDANGWPCMMQGAGPYTGGNTPHASIEGAVDYFKINLEYSSPGGTLVDPWAQHIKDYAVSKDSGASAWTVVDDNSVSDSDVTSEIDARRPLVYTVLGVAGKQFTWNSPFGSSVGHTTLNHTMAAHGYRRVVEGWSFLNICWDWFEADELYVILRSGWDNGGNKELFYHRGVSDTNVVVKVQPSGSAQCSDGPLSACPYTNDGECDEPEGLGYCGEGTDVDDCSCTWKYDGVCDDSRGTNVCPDYSDAADCN